MFENGAYYNGIAPYLKEKFGMRIAKVSVDGGFTCPNRDGTAGFGGCIFCSESGSGDFAGTRILGPETAADGRSRFTGSAENLRRRSLLSQLRWRRRSARSGKNGVISAVSHISRILQIRMLRFRR